MIRKNLSELSSCSGRWLFPIACLLSATAVAQNPAIAGQWTQQRWTGITGISISNLTSSAAFFGAPSVTVPVGSSYSSLGDNYGARTRGYITPVTTGLYTFRVSGDDETRLSISTDAGKWAAQAIASSDNYTPQSAFDESFSQCSTSRYLQAGQSYFVELLHKEGGGADHASVDWALQEAGATAETNWAAAANGAIAYSSSTYGSYSFASA